MSKKSLRKVKSKKDIVSDIQLVKDADRRRALIKGVIFPYLVRLNDTIGYSKVFLQAFNALINGVYDSRRNTTTVVQITPEIVAKLQTVFDLKDPEQKKEYNRYVELVNLIKDVSIQDLTYATELPRYIDGYLLSKKDKELVGTISIDEIMGK